MGNNTHIISSQGRPFMPNENEDAKPEIEKSPVKKVSIDNLKESCSTVVPAKRQLPKPPDPNDW